MSENSPSAIVNPEADALREENRELRDRLAQLEADKVISPDFNGEVPKYLLNSAHFLEDDTLHEEGEEIEYLGRPTLDMVPLNDAGKARMQEEIDRQTTAQRNKALAAGRSFHGFERDPGTLIAQNLQDARREADKVVVISMPEAKGEVPTMPHTEQAQAIQRRRGRPSKSSMVVSSKPAPKPERPGPKPAAILGKDFTQGVAQRQG